MHETPESEQPNIWWKAGTPPIWENDHGRFVTVRHGEVVSLTHHPDEDDETFPLQLTGHDWQHFHQQTALTTIYGHWSPQQQQAHAGLGLTNKAGEVAGKLQELLRDDNGPLDAHRREAIIDECGDVLWYLARVLESVDVDLWDAAEMNTAKIARHQENATLKAMEATCSPSPSSPNPQRDRRPKGHPTAQDHLNPVGCHASVLSR